MSCLVVHPGEPFYPGAFATLAECNAVCIPTTTSWAHAPGSIPCRCYEVDPADPPGPYPTEAACMAAECITPIIDEMPVGAIVAYPGAFAGTTPSSTTDYLLCDGGEFLDTQYPDLAIALALSVGVTPGTHVVPNLCVPTGQIGNDGGVHIEGFTGTDPSGGTGDFPVMNSSVKGTDVSHTHPMPHTHDMQHQHNGFTTAGEGDAPLSGGISGGVAGPISEGSDMQATENYQWGNLSAGQPSGGNYGWFQTDGFQEAIGNYLSTSGTQLATARGGHQHADGIGFTDSGGGGFTVPGEFTGHRHTIGSNQGGSSGANENGPGTNAHTKFSDLNINTHRHYKISTSTGTLQDKAPDDHPSDITNTGDPTNTNTGGQSGVTAVCTRPKSVHMNWIIRAQ